MAGFSGGVINHLVSDHIRSLGAFSHKEKGIYVCCLPEYIQLHFPLSPLVSVLITEESQYLTKALTFTKHNQQKY